MKSYQWGIRRTLLTAVIGAGQVAVQLAGQLNSYIAALCNGGIAGTAVANTSPVENIPKSFARSVVVYRTEMPELSVSVKAFGLM
jgi:hypothetical protein